MNKSFHYIIAGSLVALLGAIGGCLFLLWQTMAESRFLEQQNKELQASLEVSRIRVENFCDYPADTLCRVDERTGTVIGAMGGVLPGTVESAPADPLPTPVDSSVFASAGMQKPADAPKEDPANAILTVQKVASAQALVAAEVSENIPATTKVSAVPAKPIPASPAFEEKVEPASPAPLQKPEKTEKAPLLPPVESPAEKTAAQNLSAPSTDSAGAEKLLTDTNLKKDDEEKPAAVMYRHEFSGQLAPLSPAENAKPEASLKEEKSVQKKTFEAFPAEKKPLAESKPVQKKEERKHSAKKKAVVHQKVVTEVRKSWSRVEDDGGIFAFTITGSGDSLPVDGRLLSSPWRYELVLDGKWDVKKHTGIKNRLVSSMKTVRRGDSTVLIFHLKDKPYRCSLHRPDSRTASLRIR